MNDRALPRGTVAVVGPGRVGTVLVAALRHAGHRITAAAGGSEESRRRFATRFPAAGTGVDPTVAAGADLIVVATPDDAVADVVAALAGPADALGEGQRVVHVAGSLGLSPLRPARLAGARVAACHPAQTIPSADADPAVLH
ncbi:MAG: NAD(P)-binding domain-containing protein, partial [Actinomycetota bacterium]|nr:NAD(P)-binding domain-containing protein [Actinomycetota bacterium]